MNPKEVIMHDFYIVLYALAFGKVKFLDKKLNLYRQHEDNTLGAETERVYNTFSQKIHSFFNKETQKRWHKESQPYYRQVKHLIKNNPDKHNETLEKFIKISEYKNGAHRVAGFVLNHFRQRDWYAIIRRGF